MKLVCDTGTFQPVDCAGVQWLDWGSGFEMWRRFCAPRVSVSREGWQQARDDGYRYCAVVRDGEIASIAAEYRFSEDAWMVAAVATAPRFRGRGYAKRVVSFITAQILDAGRLATCHTRDDNVAMIRTAQSVGFRESQAAGSRDG